MQVDTPLSLYTMVIGWQVYDGLWDILTHTGVAYLPFLGVLFNSFFLDRIEGHTIEDRPKEALIRVEARIFLMLFAVGLGAAPCPGLAITPGMLQYAPTSDGPLPPANPGATYGGSGFGAPINGHIPIPIWFFVTIAVSEGLNRATLAILPQLQGFQEIEQAARLTHVEDPTVRAEVDRFYTDCYVPARSLLMRDQPQDVGPDDVNWLGGAYLLDTYYPRLRSSVQIQGFAFDPDRDTEWVEAPPSGWGRPDCDQWWKGDGDNAGLRARLLGQVNATGAGLTGWLVDALPAAIVPEAVEDAAIKAMLSRNPASYLDTSLYDQRGGGSDEDPLRNSIVGVGLQFAGVFMDLVNDIVTLGLPVMQALILMFVFALLPFGIIFSSYSFSFLISASIFIFSIFFWIPLWHMVEWVREQMLVSLFQGKTDVDSLVDALLMADGISLGDTTNRLIINLACASLYFLAPAIFTWLLSIAGMRFGGALNNALHGAIGSQISKAAESTSGEARNVVRRRTGV